MDLYGLDLTWNIHEITAANLSITEMKSFIQKELKDIQTQSRAVALHIGNQIILFLSILWPFVFSVIFLCDSKELAEIDENN